MAPDVRPDVMNDSALAWAARQNVSQATAKLLLIQLATMVDNDFSCRASVQTLATAISKKNGAARRALHILEDLDLIACHSQFGADGSRLANRYYINHTDAHQLTRPKEFTQCDTAPPIDTGMNCDTSTGAPCPHNTGMKQQVYQQQPTHRPVDLRSDPALPLDFGGISRRASADAGPGALVPGSHSEARVISRTQKREPIKRSRRHAH